MAALAGRGPGLYGVARAIDDSEAARRADEAHQSDQAIRGERLSQERELAPLRRRSAELGLDQAEHAIARRPQIEADEDLLRQLNVDSTKYTLEQRKKATDLLAAAQKKEERLKQGLGQFHSTGDPQYVASALSDLYLSDAGTEPGDRFTATRNPDGSITMNGPQGAPYTFKTQKFNGVERSPDDQLAMHAYKTLNPLEVQKKRLDADLGIEKEETRQSGATDRAIIRETGRAEAAGARANKERDRRVGVELKEVSREVERGLKTKSIPGEFQSYYANEDDAQLLMTMKTRAADIYKEKSDDEAMTPQRAAEEAVTDVRTAFMKVKKSAMDASKRLIEKKIDPQDRAAVEAAAAGGNADARALLLALKASKTINPNVDTYLLGQLPKLRK